MADYSRDPPPYHSTSRPNYERDRLTPDHSGRLMDNSTPDDAAGTPSESSQLIPTTRARKRRRRRSALTALTALFLFATVVGMILIIIMVTIQVDGEIDGGGGHPRWPWEREGDWDWDRRGRQRMNLRWDQPVGRSQCLAYGSREYTARLWNIPTGYSWMKACENTTVEINGITFSKPDFCEDKGIWGVYGHWIIHTGEMTCQPYWGSFLDEGCVVEGSHLHRVRSRLWNIESGNNWMKMCSTTPATLHNQHFTSPTYCEDQGILGIYGIWDYKDLDC